MWLVPPCDLLPAPFYPSFFFFSYSFLPSFFCGLGRRLQTVLYTTFDVTGLLVPGAVNHVGALLGTYKWGYTDQWVNMTAVGGPDGARVLILRLVVRQSCNLAILQSYNLEASVLRGVIAFLSPCSRLSALVSNFMHGGEYQADGEYQACPCHAHAYRLLIGLVIAIRWVVPDSRLQVQ